MDSLIAALMVAQYTGGDTTIGGERVEGSGTTHPVTAYLAGLGIPEQSKHRSLIALRGVYLGLSASITLSRALLVSRSRMNQPW